LIIGGGVVKLKRLWVVCPACGRKVEAVATDGRVKGYCAVRGQYVDFPVDINMPPMPPSFAGKHHTPESKAKMAASRQKYLRSQLESS